MVESVQDSRGHGPTRQIHSPLGLGLVRGPPLKEIRLRVPDDDAEVPPFEHGDIVPAVAAGAGLLRPKAQLRSHEFKRLQLPCLGGQDVQVPPLAAAAGNQLTMAVAMVKRTEAGRSVAAVGR